MGLQLDSNISTGLREPPNSEFKTASAPIIFHKNKLLIIKIIIDHQLILVQDALKFYKYHN